MLLKKKKVCRCTSFCCFAVTWGYSESVFPN